MKIILPVIFLFHAVTVLAQPARPNTADAAKIARMFSDIATVDAALADARMGVINVEAQYGLWVQEATQGDIKPKWVSTHPGNPSDASATEGANDSYRAALENYKKALAKATKNINSKPNDVLDTYVLATKKRQELQNESERLHNAAIELVAKAYHVEPKNLSGKTESGLPVPKSAEYILLSWPGTS